jgi:hypothetical protein
MDACKTDSVLYKKYLISMCLEFGPYDLHPFFSNLIVL